MSAVPKPGEVYWLTSRNARGREQTGRRPVLVVTDTRLASLGLTWVVPLTTTDRGWPLHVRVQVGGRPSLAMCEQLRSISVERLGRLVGSVDNLELSEVRAVIRDIAGR